MPASQSPETDHPREQTSQEDDLAQDLRAAEIEKTLAEAEKLRAEAIGARQTWRKFWHSPVAVGTAVAALLPILATAVTAIYAYNSGLLDARQKELEAQRASLKAEVTQLEAQKTLLEAQKTKLEGTFDAEKKLQEAQREHLTSQNEGLKRDEEDFKKRKSEFDAEKALVKQQIESLTSERDRLKNEVKQAALAVPLNSLLANERDAASYFNANYTAILEVLKRDPSEANRTVVLEAVERAKSWAIKAHLQRVLYLGTRDRRFLESLATMINSHWADADFSFFSSFSVFSLPAPWTDDDRAFLINTLADILPRALKDNKIDSASYIASTLAVLCGCEKRAPELAMLARTIVFAAGSDNFTRAYSPMSLIFRLNPFAGQLIFARAWSLGAPHDAARFSDSARYFIRGQYDFATSSTMPDASVDQPASVNKTDWETWLSYHEDDVKIVVNEDASKWPVGKSRSTRAQ